MPVEPNYRGVYRTPGFVFPPHAPDYAGEAEAINAYTFGNYVDENCHDLIPDFERAMELLSKFQGSTRKYEIIYVSADDSPPPISAPSRDLGYDVAVCRGEWYSIVADFPQTSSDHPIPRDILDFAKSLNEFGLFPSRQLAEDYLKRYLELRLHDWQMSPWGVVKIWEFPGHHT